MENEIAKILANGDRFLVVSHVNPDGDAIGSLMGLSLALEDMGKDVWALMPDNKPTLYDFLPEPRNLAKSFEDAPMDRDWIISLDAAEKSRIAGEINGYLHRGQLINIDHHPTNPGFGHVNMVRPEANSTAEMVFRLLRTIGLKISPEVGICLYTGLVTDTGCFRFSGVNAETFKIASELLDTGVDAYEVCRRLYEEFPPHRLKLEKAILDRMEIHLDGRLCISVIYQEDFNTYGGQPSDIEGVVNRLRSLRGVEVGALITEVSGNGTKASLRSKNDIDVAKIALSLGGGGHHRASGLRSEMPPADLKLALIKAIDNAFNGDYRA